MTMNPLLCKQCGGTINPEKMRCEYCGTRYERDEDLTKPLRVTYQVGPRPAILQNETVVDNRLIDYVSDAEEISRFIHSEVTRRMAEALEPYVEYQVQEDPFRQRQIVRGRVRVLPPGFRFD